MKIKDFEIFLDEEVYKPREDSLLLVDVVENFLRKNKVKRILDVGTGTGIQALVASGFCKDVLAVDVNSRAIELAKRNAKLNNIKNIRFEVSDLFESVKGKFDLIIFNPPYLPVDDSIKGSEQWSCGENLELLKRFATDVKKHLKKDGTILIVISSLTGLEEVKKMFEEKGLKVEIVKTKKIPWETLYALEIVIKKKR